MKVLLINSVCGIRSTGRICTDIAEELEKQGHKVKIAYGREIIPEKYQKYAVRIGSEWSVRKNALSCRLLDAEGFSAKRETKAFIQWAKEYDPDVIHLHNIHGYYINIDILFDYLKSSGKKVIWTLHDCWAFTGHSAYCDAVHCERWMDGCYNCPQKKEYPKSYIDKSKRNWIRKKNTFTGVPNMTIITPSHWLAGLVKKSFLNEYPVEVIHNGIDTDKFFPLKNDFREQYGVGDRFMLLGVSSVWNDLKGYGDFIKLAQMLNEHFAVVMVGLSKEQIHSLPRNIIGIERTASIKELSYIYSSADLFLNLTYCDNYPNVNIEAVACGTPVLTYDTGGSPEIIQEYGGYIISKGNINAVYRQVMQCEKYGTEMSRYAAPETVRNAKMLTAYSDCYSSGERGYFLIKERLGLIGKYVVLGVASVWDRRKGLADIIELGRRLDKDYRLVVVGLSQKQFRDLPKNIVGITKTNNVEELRELYAASDVFVNPTYEDNYPTTNLEAQACGTPVVTYRTGGSPESVDGEKGTVDTGDIYGLYRTIASNKYSLPHEKSLFDKHCKSEEYLRLY